MGWNDLAKDNQTAASKMLRAQRWRSSVSRAYYAAYSAATERLVHHRITMPAGRTNPTHSALPNLIKYNLTSLSYPLRGQMANAVKKLYNLRLMADYMPEVVVGETEARVALGFMVQAFRCLGR